MENERLCIFCKHWDMQNQGHDWSDATPGCDYDEGCALDKGIWSKFDSFKTTENEYRQMITYARICADFHHVFLGDK